MSSEIPNSGDLFWQAFRYASNELTSAERQAFDTLLEADQRAREAVARVIELEGLVLAAESTPVTAANPVRLAVPSYWMQPVGWIALGAAACLAVVMAFQAWWPVGAASLQVGAASPLMAVASPNSDGAKIDGAHIGGRDAVAGDLALAWAQAQAQLPAHDDSAIDLSNEDAVNHDAVDPDRIDQDIARVDDDQLAAAPAWLLAAVADTEAVEVEN